MSVLSSCLLLRLLYDSTTVTAAYMYISLRLHHSSHLVRGLRVLSIRVVIHLVGSKARP